MSNDLAIINKKDTEVAEKLDIDIDLYRALRYSLFPDPTIPEIAFGMYLGYCKAKGYDPLKKPMHIVMIGTKTDKINEKGKNIYDKNPTIMPGIISYRIDAVRTGTFYGISDAEYGPIITGTFDGKKVEYPEWCRIVIYKKIGDMIREIPAKLYWVECYATAGFGTTSPNTMWCKRPRAMLEKCVEALAYRKGFPEEIGALPTHEEMEGRNVIDAEVEEVKDEPKQNAPLSVSHQTDPDILQIHLDAIKNCNSNDELRTSYNEAKAAVQGDKSAIDKLMLATKERREYVKQAEEIISKAKLLSPKEAAIKAEVMTHKIMKDIATSVAIAIDDDFVAAYENHTPVGEK